MPAGPQLRRGPAETGETQEGALGRGRRAALRPARRRPSSPKTLHWRAGAGSEGGTWARSSRCVLKANLFSAVQEDTTLERQLANSGKSAGSILIGAPLSRATEGTGGNEAHLLTSPGALMVSAK